MVSLFIQDMGKKHQMNIKFRKQPMINDENLTLF